MLEIRYLTYSMFHNKRPPVGSDFIRVEQLLKYWPEAALYKYGENPDVMVFTKVFAAADYKFPIHFEGIKILDICDPMWLEGMAVAETARAMDAITCPTENMAAFMRQLTDAPVIVIPDRWDIDPKVLKPPRQHLDKAQTVIWFGYAHNADTLRPALRTINELGLKLLIVSNDDPLVHRFDTRDPKEYYTYRKYDNDSIDKHLREADFAILPGDYRPEGRFKSNNKTTKAILAGLPVAVNGEDLRQLVDPQARRSYMTEHYAMVKKEYDVRNSVAQMKEIIAEAQRKRHDR